MILSRTKNGLIIILICCLHAFTYSQNLVPNSSFEDIDSCPQALHWLEYADSWFSPVYPLWTHEVFNVCATPNSPAPVSVPKNLFGTQHAHTGNGYAGFWASTNTYYRELLEVELLSPLKPYHLYTIEFYLSLADDFGNAGVPIAAWFTKDSVKVDLDSVLNLKPQFYDETQTVNSKINWIKVSGTFAAKGGEKFLTLGVRGPHGTEKWKPTYSGQTSFACYYYIDDITVTSSGIVDTAVIDTTGITVLIDSSPIIIPNVFTPNGDGFNDVFEYKNIENKQIITQVYNRWGQLLYFDEDLIWWDGTHNGSHCPEGVYYYIVETSGVMGKRRYQGAVHLLR